MTPCWYKIGTLDRDDHCSREGRWGNPSLPYGGGMMRWCDEHKHQDDILIIDSNKDEGA